MSSNVFTAEQLKYVCSSPEDRKAVAAMVELEGRIRKHYYSGYAPRNAQGNPSHITYSNNNDLPGLWSNIPNSTQTSSNLTYIEIPR